MPRFTFEAVAPTGHLLRGTEEAASSSEVKTLLRARGAIPTRISACSGSDGRRRKWLTRGPGRRTAEAARICRYLASLLAAHVPLDRALRIAARAARSSLLADGLTSIQAKVREGEPLAEALAEQPALFPRLAAGLIAAGEESGQLERAFERLAETLDRRHRLRMRLQTALLYPSIMALVGGVTLAVLLLFVLPRFSHLLADAGVPMPLSTRLLLGLGTLVGRCWPALLLTGGACIVALARWFGTDGGRRWLHARLLRAPLLASIRRSAAAGHLGHTLATLLEGGLPMIDALEAAARAMDDEVARLEVRAAREQVRVGQTLAAAMADCRALPREFVDMVAVGEEAGRLPEMLERAGRAAEAQMAESLERLVRLAEPVMIVVFAALVGFVALALLQAVYGVQAGGMAR
jgi:type II secretory pathway component PulF